MGIGVRVGLDLDEEVEDGLLASQGLRHRRLEVVVRKVARRAAAGHRDRLDRVVDRLPLAQQAGGAAEVLLLQRA